MTGAGGETAPGPDPGHETAPGPDPGRAVVVGPGRVGLTLAEGLQAAGIHRAIQVVGRETSPPPFLAGRAGLSYLGDQDWSSPPGREGTVELFLAVPDEALEAAVATWVSRMGNAESSLAFAFHTSGAHPPGTLGPLRSTGAGVGVLHPLRAIPAPEAGGLAGAWFGVSGDEAAVLRGRTLVAALGGRTLRVRPEASSRYHAAAVLASNLLAGCVALARREMAAATDASGDDVRRAVTELASSALRSLGRERPAEGLTGPLARGDLETVAGHLRALEDGTTRDAYTALTRGLAHHVLELDGPELRELEDLLGCSYGLHRDPGAGEGPAGGEGPEERGSEDGS